MQPREQRGLHSDFGANGTNVTLKKEKKKRALDEMLQTGSGTQSLHLSTHTDQPDGERPPSDQKRSCDTRILRAIKGTTTFLEMQVSIRAENKADGN